MPNHNFLSNFGVANNAGNKLAPLPTKDEGRGTKDEGRRMLNAENGTYI
ncbi:MAG: hypothetical protein M0Q38_15795 [Bacteroidales bacterium]|nr:hypothetical protein [Bacteroidales bacterium]